MSKKEFEDLVSNRKAFHDYEILETFEAGIALVGTEVKALREHTGSLQDAYVLVDMKGDVILKGASISPYKFGNIHNHAEKRDRKLLLHKREIIQLQNATAQKGYALIPIAFYLKKGLIKLKIGIGKGKKNYDKRQALKEREHKKAIDRAMKDH